MKKIDKNEKRKNNNMQKVYEIEVEETLQKVIHVKADSMSEALEKVKEGYKNQEIILDSEDFKKVNYEVYESSFIKTSKGNISECKYKANIYETKEQYNKKAPFTLGIYSDIEVAKKELSDCVSFNNYYVGYIVEIKTGQEVFWYLK